MTITTILKRVRLPHRAAPSPAPPLRKSPERQPAPIEALAQFSEDYEAFIEVVCDAAQYGPGPRLQSQFEKLGTQLELAYQDLRPLLTPHLESSASDASRSLERLGPAEDAFDRLFGSARLEDLLLNDDGTLLSRIVRTRRSIALCAEGLLKLKHN